MLFKFINISQFSFPFQFYIYFQVSSLFQSSKIIQFQLQFQFHVLLVSFSFRFINKTSNRV